MFWRAPLLIAAGLPVGLAAAQEVLPLPDQPDASARPLARPGPPASSVATASPPVAAEPAPPARPAAGATKASVTTPDDVRPATPPDADAPMPGPPAWQALTEDEFTYQSCLLGLSMLGVSYAPLAPVTSPEDPDCGIARPLNITEIQPGISIAGGATMRCDTARRLALWVRNDAVPAVRHLPGAPRITEIVPGSTYQCRARVGGSQDKLSEHALGNAFDVSALRLSDATELNVSPRDETGDMAEAVQKAMRYSACLYFTTVLGPGSNAAHDDHLHFDIAARKGGWRLCE